MTFEAVPDRVTPGEWRVEAINYASEGEVYVAIFAGPLAEERAKEYARWKNESAGQRAA